MGKLRTARKNYRCRCGFVIKAGTQYVDSRSSLRNGMAIRLCPSCAYEDERDYKPEPGGESLPDEIWAM